MSTFTLFRIKEAQPMRPYVPGEDMTDIYVFKGDTVEEGGMIAMHPQDAEYKWYVPKHVFLQQYEMVMNDD